MLKRIFDILIALFGLLLLSPVLIIIAIIINFRMSRPVLYRQERVGKRGELFTIYKFRTMIPDHKEDVILIKKESRITSLGAFLRKYKLDELPELWNVLIGDMSLVGPRPDMPEYMKKLVGDEKKILELRPGITSPATLKYAREEEILSSVTDPEMYKEKVLWPDKVNMNLDYYQNRNFSGDLLLIFKTIVSCWK